MPEWNNQDFDTMARIQAAAAIAGSEVMVRRGSCEVVIGVDPQTRYIVRVEKQRETVRDDGAVDWREDS